jgi:hypothetical protein
MEGMGTLYTSGSAPSTAGHHARPNVRSPGCLLVRRPERRQEPIAFRLHLGARIVDA